jgi:hypothetical protein
MLCRFSVELNTVWDREDRRGKQPFALICISSKRKMSTVGNRQAAAKDLQTPVTILEQLAEDPIFIVRKEVATNPNASAVALAKLIADPEDDGGYLVQEVAGHHHVSAAVLSQIFADRTNWSTRYANCAMSHYLDPIIARHRNTPVEILERLAEDGNVLARSVVAENPNTPVEILERLAEDGLEIDRGYEVSRCDEVRAALASNPHTSAAIFARLASDKCDSVRTAVAGSLYAPESALAILANDPQYNVWHVLRDHPVFQADLQVARNPDTSLERLIALSRSPYSFVRAAVRTHHPHPRQLIQQVIYVIRLIK